MRIDRRMEKDKNFEDSFYSETNMCYLQCNIQQLNEGKVITKTMEELENMENE